MKRRDAISEIAKTVEQELRAIDRALRRPVEADMARGALTGPQRSVMRALVYADGLSLKDLSAEVGLSHSTVSGIVDRLEAQGIVARRVDPADRRRTVIAASTRVREYVRTTLPGLTLHPLATALRNMREDDRGRLLSALRQLREALTARP
jgi:MarR family transcriptional regulator, organic hydroperoxide resistance regulator